MKLLLTQLPEPFILLGDFNAKHEVWEESESDVKGVMIVDLLTETELTLLNTGLPTHYHVQSNSSHAVDLAFCTPCLYPALQWGVMDDLYESDHYPIRIDTTSKIPQRKQRYNIAKVNWSHFSKFVYDTSRADDLSIQDRYENLQNFILDAANRTIPKTNPNLKRPVPWWTAECDHLGRERKSALRRYQRSGLMVDQINYKRMRAKTQFHMNRIKRESW